LDSSTTYFLVRCMRNFVHFREVKSRAARTDAYGSACSSALVYTTGTWASLQTIFNLLRHCRQHYSWRCCNPRQRYGPPNHVLMCVAYIVRAEKRVADAGRYIAKVVSHRCLTYSTMYAFYRRAGSSSWARRTRSAVIGADGANCLSVIQADDDDDCSGRLSTLVLLLLQLVTRTPLRVRAPSFLLTRSNDVSHRRCRSSSRWG
jgi:hypothetical protein